MRSRYFVCAALASLGLLLVGPARTARAADAKAKQKKNTGSESSDGIGKTLQWEDKVMGPDDKRSELDKILKAQAINRAATEKAERDKEKADKEKAAREAKEAAAPKPTKDKRGGEVALPTMPDEEPASKSKSGKSVEISPKLDTAAAAAPPPPSKPADDKFIDKLLKEEGGGKKKKGATASNNDLLDIIGTGPAKGAAAKPKGKKSDGVDNLLLEADKEPAMPTPKIKHETPEWQKPEIQSTPAPVAMPKAPPKKQADDGVIRVVQGAIAPAGKSAPAAPAARPAPVATRGSSSMTSTSRRAPTTAPSGSHNDGWNDPFADSGPRKAPASRSTRQAALVEEEEVAPAPRRNASAKSRRGGDDDAWEDPFDVKREKSAAGTRRATTPAPKAAPPPPARPARSNGWKDPFTEEKPSRPARGAVAMRDSGRESSREETSNKWSAAAKHPAADDADDEAPAQTKGRWGIIKKRAH